MACEACDVQRSELVPIQPHDKVELLCEANADPPSGVLARS